MATEADYKRLGAWAVMLNPDANIDRHYRNRTVPMEVLSLGFSRTGTLSMQEALTILGYPTYHYSNIFSNVKDAEIWREALDAKFNNIGSFEWKEGLDQVLGDYRAVTDAPSVIFWKELIDSYPHAKVVLVEREEEKWHKSISVLFEGVLNPAATYVSKTNYIDSSACLSATMLGLESHRRPAQIESPDNGRRFISTDTVYAYV